MHKRQIQEILNGLQYSKDFVCYTSGQKKLCKAEDIGLQAFLLCIEKNPKECKFSVAYGGKHFLSMSSSNIYSWKIEEVNPKGFKCSPNERYNDLMP